MKDLFFIINRECDFAFTTSNEEGRAGCWTYVYMRMCVRIKCNNLFAAIVSWSGGEEKTSCQVVVREQVHHFVRPFSLKEFQSSVNCISISCMIHD